MLFASAAPAAHAQSNPCNLRAPALRAESARYVVPFAMSPEPAVGRHFTLMFTLCSRDEPAKPESVSVDARMPGHGHGMNYRALIKAVGNGRYRAEGLMFHMPGEWELTFTVVEGGVTERITRKIDLR